MNQLEALKHGSRRNELVRKQSAENFWGDVVNTTAVLSVASIAVAALAGIGSIFSKRMEKAAKKSAKVAAGSAVTLAATLVQEARTIVKRSHTELQLNG